MVPVVVVIWCLSGSYSLKENYYITKTKICPLSLWKISTYLEPYQIQDHPVVQEGRQKLFSMSKIGPNQKQAFCL